MDLFDWHSVTEKDSGNGMAENMWSDSYGELATGLLDDTVNGVLDGFGIKRNNRFSSFTGKKIR